MTIFYIVKDSVDIADAAERYGLQLDRRGKALCPFHSDTHPSMSFKNGGYYCFACNSKGDVISLVSRLTGASKPIEAVRLLNHEYGLGLDINGEIDPVAARRYARERERIEACKQWEQKACNTWAAYCQMLRGWKRDYAPQSPEDEPDPRFAMACNKLEYADFVYETIFIDGYRDLETQARFYKSHGQEVRDIEQLFRQYSFTG